MAGQNTKILLTDYNSIQSSIAGVLGIGGSPDASYGYNQQVMSSSVASYATVTTLQWVNLQSDIIRARQHQTGTNQLLRTAGAKFTGSITGTTLTVTAIDYGALAIGQRIGGNTSLSSNIFITGLISGAGGTGTYTIGVSFATAFPSTANLVSVNVIAEVDRAAYATMANACITDRLIVESTQLSLDTLSSAIYTAAWNNAILHTVTLTFADANAPRGFFNAGGQIAMSAALTGGAGLKDNAWAMMLTNMGTILFGRVSTTATGTGVPAATVGYASITTADQLIFQKITGTAVYSPNQYDIYVRQGSSVAQLIFSIYFKDLSGQPNPPWGTDEMVTGAITSTLRAYRPSGTNVSIQIPSIGSTFT